MSDTNSEVFRLAPFWADDPELWFANADAQFWYYKITEDVTKYMYITAHLDKPYLTIIRDLIVTPPAANKYETLKMELLKRLKDSKIENMKEIMKTQDIGDRKPSEFLYYLKDLVGEDVNEAYIKSEWASRLPASVQWVSSFQNSSSLAKLAHLADLAVASLMKKGPEIKSLPSKAAEITPVKGENSNELEKRVDVLTKRVDDLSTNLKKGGQELLYNYRGTGSMKTASTLSLFNQFPSYLPNKKFQGPPVLCWYHAHFAWKASKCVKPCNFLSTRLNLF